MLLKTSFSQNPRKKHLCKCLFQSHMLCQKQETQYTIEWLPSVPGSVPLRLRNKVWLCQWNLRYEMNGISCNSILRGLDGIKKISFHLFYFQFKVHQGPNGKKVLIQSQGLSPVCLATISWTPWALMHGILKTKPLWHPHPIQIENCQIDLTQGLETCHFGLAGHMTRSSCSASTAKIM